MATVDLLKIKGSLPVVPQNAGLFISRGAGIHPTRVIGSYELIFVRQGRLGMFEGRRRFELGAGQTLLLWPGWKHGGTIPYPQDLSFYWIHFTLNPGAMKYRPVILLSVRQTAILRQPDRLVELFRRFLDDQESGRLTPVNGACLIIQMLTEVSRGFKNTMHENSSSIVLASRAEDYIRTHFNKSISARDIARTLRCNPDYLGRIFHLAFDCTLTERLHQRRIQKAKSLLLDGKLNINEIASDCGFNDAVFFRRIFERKCDMTPLAFRKLYARVHVNTV
jgi:AraC-like DNA-binding protein